MWKAGERIMLESLWQEDFTLHGVNALRQYWQEGETYSFRRSPRPQHGLMLLTGGETLYETRAGERLHARRGDLVWLGKGAGYTARFVNVTARPYSLLVNFQLTDARGGDMSGEREVTLLPLRGAQAEAPMRRLVDLYYDPDYAPAEMKGRLYELICLVSRCLSGRSGVPPELAAAFEWMSAHPRAPVSELAARCALSESAFRKRFGQYAGVSPSEYRIARQIEQAARLLRASSAGVEEIALSVGFADVNYFCRAFRKRMGITALEYRKQSDLC